MAKKKRATKKSNYSKKYAQSDKEIFAFLATFLSIIGFVIALIVRREDKYVMFYAKQSLVIFIIGVIAGIASSLVAWLPIMGSIISFALGVIIFIAWLLSWIYALSGEKKNIPIVNYWTEKIDL